MFNKNITVKKLCFYMNKKSPVLIIGKAGTGKTHILNDLLCKISDGAILTGEELGESFVKSIRQSTVAEWKANLYARHYLIIDDIDFFECKFGLQRELIKILKYYKNPIVVTAKQKFDSEKFCDDFISCFYAGKLLNLSKLTRADKKKFFKKSICESALNITQDAVRWLLKQKFDSYSSMQGFIKTMQAHSLVHEPITVDMCRMMQQRFNMIDNED